MAEECTESSVATSSSTPSNWWDLHASSLSSWSNTNAWNPSNPNSNSSCEEDVSISTSFTNASNHSGLTVESSRSNELLGEPASDNHLWSHVLLVGSNEELNNSQDENMLDALSSKSISTGMFEPACSNYLKKMDDSWEFTNSTSLNNLEKHLNGFTDSFIESERLTKLSNLVSNWSIAPPEPDLSRQFDPQTCNISLNSWTDSYSKHDLCNLKHTFSDSTSCGIGANRSNLGLFTGFGHDLKIDNEQREVEAPAGSLFRRSLFNSNDNNGIGYQIGLGSSIVGDNSKYYCGMTNYPTARNLADVISFGSRFSKPLVDIHVSKPCLKPLNLSDCKKQGLHNSSSARINGRGQGITNEGKKKRSEDTSETVLKKPKHESSAKMQAPKVKLGDRITALQQIVAPFGKTDTASVLLEAIQYIQFLQEQVKLLSNPYMKTNSHKDIWGSLERKEKGDGKLELRSRGLCLVPISCTPQVCRENTGSDYWTPTYRGCLYR